MPKFSGDAPHTHDEPGVQLEQIGSRRPPSTIQPNNIDDVEKSWKAWLVTLGSFMFLFPSFGFMLSVGVLQQYLAANQLSNYSARDVGWIPGLYNFLALLLGIQAGPLADHYSMRILAPLSLALTAPMFFIMGECTKYWHFILCMGVLGGTGGALASTVAVAAVSKVFLRQRGLAMSAALAGCSLAAIVFPLILRTTLPKLGFAWSMRILGFIVTAGMSLAVACFWDCDRLVALAGNAPVRTRSARITVDEEAENTMERISTARSRKPGAQLNFSAFRSAPFILITVTQFLIDFVVFGISGLLPTLATSAGFSAETGYTLVAVLNGACIIGRLISGYVADRQGPFNIVVVTILFSAVSVAITLVPFGSKHIEALYAFAVVWGIGSGSFLPLLPVCLGKTCDAKDYGRYYGTMNFVISFGLLITVPVGGQMLDSMGGTSLSGFYVAVLVLGGVSLFAARALILGTWFGFKEKI